MAIEREIKIMKGYADRGIVFVNPRNKMEKREVNTFTSIQEDILPKRLSLYEREDLGCTACIVIK